MSKPNLLGTLLSATLLAVPAASQDAAGDKHLLRYQLQKGTSGHFVMSQKMAMKMDMGGQPMNTDLNMEMFVEVSIDDVADGVASLRQKIYRVKMHMDNPMMGSIKYDSDDEDSDPGMLAQIEDLVGQSFAMRIDDRGKVSDFQLPRDLEENLGRMLGGDTKGMFSQFFALLPEEPIAVGDTWESSMAQSLGQMGKAKVKVKNKLAAIDGSRITLDQEMQMDLDAIEAPFDMKMEVKKAKGTTVIDLSRAFPVRSDMVMQMAMKTETEGMKMDMLMDMSISIRPTEPPKKGDKDGEGHRDGDGHQHKDGDRGK